MQITTLLSQKKAAILGRWLSMIYESYPPETAIFLRKEKNRFDNPAGYRISEGLEGLYGTLLQEMERDQVLTCLDEIIRIRALQKGRARENLLPGGRPAGAPRRQNKAGGEVVLSRKVRCRVAPAVIFSLTPIL